MQVLKKILSTSQLGNTDDFTIKSNNITSLELMENAANSFMNAMDKMHYSTKKIAVICGTGNNGGDGFAIC